MSRFIRAVRQSIIVQMVLLILLIMRIGRNDSTEL